MNWLVRNLAVAVLGAATSVATALALLFLEARTGTAVFGVTVLRMVPLGTIGAGLVGALGYLAAALVLRLRPAMLNVLAIAGVAAGVVFMVQSAEFAFFMAGSTRAAEAAQNAPAFARFVGNSVVHSPLEFWGGSDGDSAASTMFFARGTNAAGPRVMSGDSGVDGIGAGVQGVMATQDVTNTAAAQHAAQIGAGIETIGAKVKTHGSVWSMLLLQGIGFAVGGLAVFGYLRTLPHCKSCMLLLDKKGQRTRYFSRTREMRLAVDEVLTRAREKQLQQSILMHLAKGSAKRQQWSEYCSTFAIRRCIECNTYQLDYHARRKDGATWKDIALLGFSAETLEPVNFG
jgi:hypothetical protein